LNIENIEFLILLVLFWYWLFSQV